MKQGVKANRKIQDILPKLEKIRTQRGVDYSGQGLKLERDIINLLNITHQQKAKAQQLMPKGQTTNRPNFVPSGNVTRSGMGSEQHLPLINPASIKLPAGTSQLSSIPISPHELRNQESIIKLQVALEPTHSSSHSAVTPRKEAVKPIITTNPSPQQDESITSHNSPMRA